MSELSRPWAGRRLHFVGVGGAGMSGYARAAHTLGASVSGSDRADSPYLKLLREEGVLDAHIGHDARNLPAGEDVELIYSSAVSAENPERVAARERGLADRPRAELLGELSALRRTIAVAGAHGKTTTSSMIVHVLRAAGLDPSWLVGSSVGAGLANSHWTPAAKGDASDGRGEWLVIEADESDRSMLSLHVEIAVLTNVELDHHATFATLAELRHAFAEFLAKAPHAVIWDRPDLHALREGPAVFYDVQDLSMHDGGSTFHWRGIQVSLSVPGAHNALNAAATLEVARMVGIDASGSIVGFKGAGRRFERLGNTPSGAQVIDDYAHHPTEVAATLQAACTLSPRRLVAVFQPHLYSRTAMLAREFGRALAIADIVVVLDVYAARERSEDYPGVSGLLIAESVTEADYGKPVYWLPDFADAEPVLRTMLGMGDVCMVMGAGDVDALARRLVRDDGV